MQPFFYGLIVLRDCLIGKERLFAVSLDEVYEESLSGTLFAAEKLRESSGVVCFVANSLRE